MSAPDTQLAVKMITLRTADGQLVPVDETVAMEFGIVRGFFYQNPDATVDTDVAADQLFKIIEYCKRHIRYKARGRTLAEACLAEFVNERRSDESLYELIRAADNLIMEDLPYVLAQNAADRARNNSFTPEEEEKINWVVY